MFLEFSRLLHDLYFSNSQKRKEMLLHQFFSSSPDPERGYALAALTGTLQLPLYRRSRIKDLLMDRVDPTLFALSYDYVGDLSETIAHLWPNKSGLVRVGSLTLAEIVAIFQGDDVEISTRFLCDCLDVMSYEDRWALLKFLGSSMRVGLSLRSCKGVLAQYAQKPIQEIEKVWHGVSPPYDTLFAWLEGRLEGELAIQDLHFTPVMLAHPVVDADLESFTWSDWQMEWKFDGIRVQYVLDKEGCWRLFSRTGEDITHSFPDLGKLSNRAVTLDGELLVGDVSNIADFNTLQQRLGKSKPTKKFMEKYPVLLMAYDILRMDGDWLLDRPLSQRRDVLQAVVEDRVSDKLALSMRQSSDNLDEVLLAKEASKAYVHAPVEGVMLKRLDSLYQSGRPTGMWWKLKRDPGYVDAVLVYAQRGHGKRSSLYSDYTFAVLDGEDWVPVGKAYSGFTNEELKRLDLWVRKNTVAQFGPMRQLKPDLVVEVAFDSVMKSPRRRAGISLRFPRIHRIRWDKPACDADTLLSLQKRL